MKVVAVAEPVDPTVKLTAWSAALFDGQGRLTRQVSATADQLTSMPVTAAILVPPGTYRMRVAAVDAAGRSGSVDTEVSAEMTAAGELKLSSLVAGLSRSGGFMPKMQFSNEPVAIGFLEIYGGVAGAPVGAIVEVARTIDGPPLVDDAARHRSDRRCQHVSRERRDPDWRAAARRLRGASARRHPGQAVRTGHQDDPKSRSVSFGAGCGVTTRGCLLPRARAASRLGVSALFNPVPANSVSVFRWQQSCARTMIRT